jgi:putative DNA primase/helicase
MKFDDIISRLNVKQRNDHDYRCKCPAHNGTSDDSLSISPGENGIALLYCHAGCTYDEITAALGIERVTAGANGSQPIPTAGKLAERPTKEKPGKIIATYDYTDESGKLLYQKVRLEPKSFRVRVPDGKGGWRWSIGDTRRVLYNLPALLMVDTVFVVEGEKDVDRLGELGIVATCNFDGASKGNQSPKWDESYNPYFEGKTVYIIPDYDEPGDAHAKHIAKSIQSYARQVLIVDLPDQDLGQDVSDWLDRGGDFEQLMELCSRGSDPPASVWKIHSMDMAYQERPPTRYLVDGIVPIPSVNVWFGAPGSKKSLILTDLGVVCAAGKEWLPGGSGGVQTQQCKVLWIDTDNGGDVMQERVAAFGRAHGVTDGFHYVTMPDPWLFISDITSQLDLETTIENLGVELVIIDNLGNITGDIDENSAQMVKIMSPLRRIADKLNIAIIVVHHQRKGGSNGGRAGDALRGHSVIEAALDFAILVATDEQSDITTIRCTKARRFRFDDLRAQFEYEHFPGTRDLKEAWWTVPTIKRGQNDIKDTIIDILETNEEMTQERLIDVVYDFLDRKYGKPKIRGWVTEMANKTDEIVVRPGKYNAKLLSLKKS